MSKTTEAELDKIMAQPEYANRTAVRVYEDGEEYMATWDGVEVRAGNPFGLDSELTNIGCPQPRNLFLMEQYK